MSNTTEQFSDLLRKQLEEVEMPFAGLKSDKKAKRRLYEKNASDRTKQVKLDQEQHYDVDGVTQIDGKFTILNGLNRPET